MKWSGFVLLTALVPLALPPSAGSQDATQAVPPAVALQRTPAGRASGWTAVWIAAPWSTVRDGAELDGSHPMPIFRREFTVGPHLAQATLRIAGMGQFQARLGSAAGVVPVGPPGLHEAWTDYRKSVRYETYDVTAQLRPGAAVLSVLLGNGMYNVQRTPGRYTKFEGSYGAPELTAELRLRYTDGHTDVIRTDGRWTVARGPFVFSSTYGGEDFDARRVQDRWESPGFRDADWSRATVVQGPGGRMEPAVAPEMTEGEVYTPVRTTEPVPGRQVFDLGQNFAGIPRLEVHGPAGATLKLTPAELLKPDGTVTQRSSGGPMWWSYTLRGGATPEHWEPQFGFYGFRYLQAEWVPAPGSQQPAASGTIVSLRGVALRSASPVTGSFSSSSQTLNRIHALIVAAMHNNEATLFTDCPHREKLGWLEETHLVAAGLIYNNDLRGLYAATAANIADAQAASGMVPTIAPQYTRFGPKYAIYDDSPEWGSAAVLAPWTAFRFYGDRTELTRNYTVMANWVRYLQSRATDGIVAYGLGDWYDIGPGGPGFEKNTSLGVTGTLMLYENAAAMAHIAALLDKPDDAAQYRTLAAKEADAFQRRFWKPAEGWYDTGSQTANAMPLALGIVPEAERPRVLAHVVADIDAHADHVTTGEVGYPYLLRALMAAGRDDVILAMMLRTDPPSYGSMLAAGATAATEAWDANPNSSQDHFMLGAGEEWFYRGLGGIGVDLTETRPEERITIRPALVPGVDWVKCGYRSALGPIESDWHREHGDVVLEITTPVAATVALPNVSGPPRMLRVQPGTHSFRVKQGS